MLTVKREKLEDICTVITDGSHHSPPTVEEGKPIASVKDMTDYDINLETCRKITANDYEALVKGKCKPQVNDVLIAKDGSFLKKSFVVEAEPEYVLLSSIGILRPNTNIVNPYYLMYHFHLESFKRYVANGFVSGTALKRIVLKAFKNIKINVPPIDVQEKIIREIKPLDEKIKVNRKLIAEFEEYTQLLFHKWFIDFNFPNEQGKPYKDSGGVMVEVEGKLIPKGWSRGRLEDIITIESGKRNQELSKIESAEHCVPVYGASEVVGYTNNYLYNEPIIITGRVGTLGVLMRENGKCWTSDNTLIIKSEMHEFAYQTLNSLNLAKLNIGSTQPLITQTDVKKQKCILPMKETVEMFESIAGVLMEKVDLLSKENILLTETRNLLIHKLIK